MQTTVFRRSVIVAFGLLSALAIARLGHADEIYENIGSFGGSGSGGGLFNNPTGIAVDAAGDFYIADDNAHLIQKVDKNGVFLAQWGGYGSAAGQFQNPRGVGIDPSGNVFVADTYNNRLQKLSAGGSSFAVFPAGPFSLPQGVACDSAGNVYVADRFSGSVMKFDSAGALQWQRGGLNWPHAVTVDPSDRVIVADTFNNRIVEYDSSGVFLRTFGSYGSTNGTFNEPFGLTTDHDGNIFVADTFNNRIQKFSPTGTFLAAFGVYGTGTGSGQLNAPQDVEVAANGDAYVCDTWNNRISIWRLQRPPVLDAIPSPQTVDEGSELAFTACANDPNGDSLTYSLIDAPSGATIDSGSGAFSWTPTEAQGPDSYTFTVKVTDSTGRSAEQSVTVNVSEVNQNPTLTVPASPLAGVAGTAVTFTATAADPDLPANTLTYSLVGAPGGASINPSSGEFRWTPSAAGVYTFTVKVVDGAGGSDLKSVTVKVVSGLRIQNVCVQRIGPLVFVSLEVFNGSTLPAKNVAITRATVDGTRKCLTLPCSLETIAPGRGKYALLIFLGNRGPAVLSVEGTSSLGGFSDTRTIAVP